MRAGSGEAGEVRWGGVGQETGLGHVHGGLDSEGR